MPMEKLHAVVSSSDHYLFYVTSCNSWFYKREWENVLLSIIVDVTWIVYERLHVLESNSSLNRLLTQESLGFIQNWKWFYLN
jgi:hypothetical protein